MTRQQAKDAMTTSVAQQVIEDYANFLFSDLGFQESPDYDIKEILDEVLSIYVVHGYAVKNFYGEIIISKIN